MNAKLGIHDVIVGNSDLTNGRVQSSPARRTLDFSWWMVMAATVLGAVIRILYQKGRSFTGDEVGTLIFMHCTPGYIVTHYGVWLSMNYYILGLKSFAHVFGMNPWVLTAPSLAGNIAAIPLTYLVGKRFAPARIAAMGAVIVAFNPYVIEFAPQIRAYSTHLALSLLAVLLYLRWRDAKSWRRGIAFAVAALLLCLDHMVGIYTVAAIAGLEAVRLVRDFRSLRWRALDARWSLVIPMLGVAAILAFTVALYHAQLKLTNAQFTRPPPGNVTYLVPVFSFFFGGDYSGFAYSILMLAGCVAVIKQRLVRAEATAFLCTPVILMALQGVSHLPSAFARFDIALVPYCALLVAAGISFIFGQIPFGKWLGWITCAVLVGSFSTPTLIAMQREKEEHQWCRVDKYLATTIRPGDLVVGSVLDVISVAGVLLENGAPPVRQIKEVDSRPFAVDSIMGPQSFRGSHITLYTVSPLAQLPDSAFASHKVYFIASDLHVRTDTPLEKEGKISVLTYSGTKTEVLDKIAADLAASTNNRRDPSLITYYLMLQNLSQALNRPTDAEHYRAMSLDCVIRMEHKWQGIPYELPGIYG
jgi:hypothetical protein